MDSPEYPFGAFLRDVLAILADENFNPRPHPELIPEHFSLEPEQPVTQPKKEETIMTTEKVNAATAEELKKAREEGRQQGREEGAEAKETVSNAWKATKPVMKTIGWMALSAIAVVAGYEGKSYMRKNKSDTGTPSA